MSSLIVFLVAFPIAVGGLLLAVRNGKLRNVIVVLAGTVVAGASVVTAVTFGNGNGKKTTSGAGAILQNDALGGGYFITTTNAGAFSLTPKQ